MNYNRLYSKFIESRPTRSKQRNDGLESHHIVPRSLGGKDNKDNLIVLTLREHFIAHRLLYRMSTGKDKGKMIYALKRMVDGQQNKGSYCINSRTYARIRELARAETIAQWTNERKRARSEAMKKRWANPAFRAKTLAGLHSPQAVEKNRQSALKQWQDPAVRDRIAEGHRRTSDQRSQHHKQLWQDPTHRAMILASRKQS